MGLLENIQQDARDYFWEAAWLQRGYSAFAAAQARATEARDPYTALLRHAAAAMRVRSGSLKERRLHDFARYVREKLGPTPATLADNPFIRLYLESPDAEIVRRRWREYPREERLDLRKNIIVLKNPRPHERGVLLLEYTDHFKSFLVNFDLRRVCAEFHLVLEPSWYPYPEEHWAMFNCRDCIILCQTISEISSAHLRDCGFPLAAIGVGAQDWVAPRVFRPLPGVEKDFDIVMIASFMRLKRHHVLYRALRRMLPRKPKVALVGRTWARTRAEFEAELRESKVADQITIFQGLSGEELNVVLNRSKLKVLLSKVEGGNVALMEALAAGTPCVVYEHVMGPRLSDFNAATGALASDGNLHRVLADVIDKHDQFSARDWFLANTGYERTTARVNAALRELSLSRGERWTEDIVPKVNRLGLQYADPEEASRMRPGWQRLEACLNNL